VGWNGVRLLVLFFYRLNNKQICLNKGQSYNKIAVTQNVTAIDLGVVGYICLTGIGGIYRILVI
jgi:hypothetical protein